MQWSVEVEGRQNAMCELSTPYSVSVTTEFLRAMGIKLVRGRAFGPEDGETSAPVTVVSESLAREFWPGQDPLGKRIHLSGPEMPWVTVVGVVRDVRPEALSEPPRPTYYLLTPQFARMVGFDHYLSKPYDPGELLRLLRPLA